MPSSELRNSPAHPVVAVSLLAMLAWSMPACTVLADTNREQCATDSDCAQRGGAFSGSVCRNSVCVTDPMWGCIGNVQWPPTMGGGRVTARLMLTDLETGLPVQGAKANICQKIDTNCNNPVARDVTSDEMGVLAVEVDKGFEGFVEIANEPTHTGTLYFFYPPLTEDRHIPYCPLVPLSAFLSLGSQLGANLDVTRGAAIAIGYDCTGTTAAGLTYSIDEEDDATLLFFMQKGLPTITSKETEGSGQGGYVNVKPGIRRLTALLQETGKRVGEVSLVVRPGVLTYTQLVPTPD